MTIWKFAIPAADRFELEMPVDAEVLAVGVQRGEAVLWAKCSPDAVTTRRWFRLIGTGNPIPAEPPLAHRGTFQIDWFVGHVFEELAT